MQNHVMLDRAITALDFTYLMPIVTNHINLSHTEGRIHASVNDAIFDSNDSCRLFAPSHYLNQSCLNIEWTFLTNYSQILVKIQ